MMDGNFGFEMETMEFLNALSSSGMPGNVFGILTHLDLFRKPETLRDAKKRLKHRFWSELYHGAKLFYLSGVINGRYPDREVHNLSRFLSVMKNPRPLIWRNSHPYCLADHFLDLTPPTNIEENPKCDRTIGVRGYLRGTNFSISGARVHVPGVGDLTASSIEALPDPCPTPFMDQAIAKASGKAGRRRLGEKQKLLYAPMSDVGGVLVSDDAYYIPVATSNFDKNATEGEERGLGEQMVVDLQSERRLLGEADNGVRLFTGGSLLNEGLNSGPGNDDGRKGRRKARPVEREPEVEEPELEGGGFAGDEEDENEDESGTIEEGDISPEKLGAAFRPSNEDMFKGHDEADIAFADSDSDIGSVSGEEEQGFESRLEDEQDKADYEDDEKDEESAALRWKSNLQENARNLHSAQRHYRVSDLARLLYDKSLTPADVVRKWRGQGDARTSANGNNDKEEDEGEDNFFRKAKHRDEEDLEDRSIPRYNYDILAQKWSDTENLENLRHRFVTANLMQGRNGEEGSINEDLENQDDEGDGEFEDLEVEPNAESGKVVDNAGTSLEAERASNARRKEELKLRFEEEDREGFAKAERKEGARDGNEEYGEDEWYDAQKAQQLNQLSINRAEFESLDPNSKLQAEGLRAGTYAKIVLEKVPYEWAANFNPRHPIVVGGLAPTEDRFGFVQVRIKRHRWSKRVLKNGDPLIFSLGWRRFQTLPIYSTSDSRTRNRMLKYTPEHTHCFGTWFISHMTYHTLSLHNLIWISNSKIRHLLGTSYCAWEWVLLRPIILEQDPKFSHQWHWSSFERRQSHRYCEETEAYRFAV